MFLSLSLTSIHDKQKQFLEALTLVSGRNPQTPVLLSPALLIQELHNIQNHIVGTDTDLPLHVSTNTLPYFYQIATTRSRIVTSYVYIRCNNMPVVEKTIQGTGIINRLPDQNTSSFHQGSYRIFKWPP